MDGLLEKAISLRFEIAAVILFGIGFINLLLQSNLIKKIVAFNVMDSSVFLFLASQGYIEGRMAPIVTNGVTDAVNYVNPIPAGLVLTGIVVSVSVSAFFLALVQRLYKHYHTVDFDEIMMLAKERVE
ncbi:MAG: cation:proton antiporter subunit C [Clostridia bacterium]|nr:cation:proton antiporter subunit C [Clostridia bacterium]MBQ2326655.1 cation:proton antiporter subunit C [Clostridia bacterium]MBQ5812908.1 cation:proton antiporter subunit C [Clostridia bacterium]